LITFSGNTELGANSPMGIVRQHVSGSIQNETQWVINFGGISKNGFYQGRVQVPVLIVILGVLGGYLRYLYGLRFLFPARKGVLSSTGLV
jgi:hypothetical protein